MVLARTSINNRDITIKVRGRQYSYRTVYHNKFFQFVVQCNDNAMLNSSIYLRSCVIRYFSLFPVWPVPGVAVRLPCRDDTASHSFAKARGLNS